MIGTDTGSFFRHYNGDKGKVVSIDNYVGVLANNKIVYYEEEWLIPCNRLDKLNRIIEC